MIFTIGHSMRPLAEFIALLHGHSIRRLADVRTVPRSKRHPHFGAEALQSSLAESGIEYLHFPGLGGLRKPRTDSKNGGWRVEGFRGYADYMETREFRAALDSLVAFAAKPTAMMCAEAVWWRCHRQLIADALVARGIDVRHITSSSSAPPHALTAFATLSGTEVRYPGLV